MFNFDFIGFVLILALSIKNIDVQVDNENLLSVVIVYRHGARTPRQFYSNDPYYYNSTIFPEGTDQLTNEGKNQQYALGLWLRSRYDGWLPAKFHVNDIYVQSTDYDRTLMSAQCNLAGLYAPKGSQIWNASLPNWQPVPIHSVPDEYDPFIATGVVCKRWNLLRDLIDIDPYFVNLHTQHDALFTYLSNNTGDSVKTFKDIKNLCDTLYIESTQYNLALPEWTRSVYPNPLEELVGYNFIQDTFNATMARLKVGRFYHKIYRYFLNIANGITTSAEPRFLMYSAHESTLGNLLNGMNAFDMERPPYAGALIFELRRHLAGNKTYLNIFYKKDDEMKIISANGCDYNCTLSDFKEHMKKVIVNKGNWEQECADVELSDKFFDYEYHEESDQ